jgi:hypothetical protein
MKANPKFWSLELVKVAMHCFLLPKDSKLTALDCSETAVDTIIGKTNRMQLSKNINALRHDVRKRLPFGDAAFDAYYCHMLFCMALCKSELESLFQ